MISVADMAGALKVDESCVVPIDDMPEVLQAARDGLAFATKTGQNPNGTVFPEYAFCIQTDGHHLGPKPSRYMVVKHLNGNIVPHDCGEILRDGGEVVGRLLAGQTSGQTNLPEA